MRLSASSSVTVIYPPVGTPSWFELLLVQTASGPRQLVRRASKEIHGAKVLALFVSEDDAALLDGHDRNTLAGICEFIRKVGAAKCSLFLLATDRPVTYFEYPPDLSANFLMELPGGAAHPGEDLTAEGMRELCEEFQLTAEHVVAFAALSDPMAWDAGAHAEWMSLAIAICIGTPRPPPGEGIIAEHCQSVRLTELTSFFARMAEQKIGVDGFVPTALGLLAAAMRGGWDSAWH